MTKYSSKEILDAYKKQLDKEKEKLEGKPVTSHVKGRIFKKIIKNSLTKELEELGIKPSIEEIPLFKLKMPGYRKRKNAKTNLIINNKILVEVKANGHQYPKWEDKTEDDKYKSIKEKTEKDKLKYLYITGKEAPKPKKHGHDYRERTIKIFGKKYTYFLDEEKKDHWNEFVKRVHSIL